MKKTNILYIHSHDTGRYIQPYGHAVSTPNLQRLAEEGILFRQAFCAAPTCSPSRACLLTGEYAHNNGMLGLAHRCFSLNDYSHHILHTLRKYGYFSVLAGIQHIAARTNVSVLGVIGYDKIIGDSSKDPNMAQLVKDFLNHTPQQPFFLSVGFFETHRRFPDYSSADNPNYCLPPSPLPDTPEIREDMAKFKTDARILDEKIGIVLDALEANGLAENTLVICTTDHGIAFPRMKCTLTDSGIGVMLIMRGPDGFSGGRVYNSLVSHIDIFPTICDLLEIEKPEWLQGVSLIPLVQDERQEVRDEILAEINYHATYEPQRCIRTKHWKYIRRFGKRMKVALPNCDDSLGKSLWMDHGWAGLEYEEETLYNLIFDPNETNNLVAKPDMTAVLTEMRNRLKQWMHNTNDPLLKGTVPAPADAEMNDPDGISHTEAPFLISKIKEKIENI